MSNDDWKAEDAMDTPVEAITAGGVARVSGAVWQDGTEELGHLYRRAAEKRRLFGDAADDVEDDR